MRRHTHVNQTRKRKIDLGDFVQVDVFTDTGKSFSFLFRQHQRHILAHFAPLLAFELDVRAGGCCARHTSNCAKGVPKTGKRVNKGGIPEWCCFRGLPHKGLAWPVALKFH